MPAFRTCANSAALNNGKNLCRRLFACDSGYIAPLRHRTDRAFFVVTRYAAVLANDDNFSETVALLCAPGFSRAHGKDRNAAPSGCNDYARCVDRWADERNLIPFCAKKPGLTLSNRYESSPFFYVTAFPSCCRGTPGSLWVCVPWCLDPRQLNRRSWRSPSATRSCPSGSSTCIL